MPSAPSSETQNEKWLVETRAIVRRQYFVDAEDEKSAEAASCDTTCDHEEDDDEETMDDYGITAKETKMTRSFATGLIFAVLAMVLGLYSYAQACEKPYHKPTLVRTA